MKEDMNFNYSECIKSYDKLGETIYQNICNGETTTLPWGFGGYAIMIFLILVCIVLIGVAAAAIKTMFE